MLNVLGSTPLAGFQVILIGRFWVIPEAREVRARCMLSPMVKKRLPF